MPKTLKAVDMPPEIAALQSYVATEQANIAQKRKEAMTAKGMKDFYKFGEGETRFKLLPVKPRERTGDFGEQAIFRIEVSGTEYDWSVSKKSPLFRELLGWLLKSPKTMKLIRLGLGKDTRMSLKEA